VREAGDVTRWSGERAERGMTVRGRLVGGSKGGEIELWESGEGQHGDGHNGERYQV
jgi:hypothetical protein